VAAPIAIATFVVVIFGVMPDWLVGMMQAAAVPMLTTPAAVDPFGSGAARNPSATRPAPPAPPTRMQYTPEQLERMRKSTSGGGPPAKGAFPKAAGKSAAGKRAASKGALKGEPSKGDTGKAAAKPATAEFPAPPAKKGN